MEKELKEKIKKRARRAWEEPKEKHHRITEVEEKTLIYRVKTGTTVVVSKDSLGRIRIK